MKTNVKEINQYLNEINSRKSPHTVRLYTKSIEYFVNFFNPQNIEDVLNLTKSDFVRFQDFFTENQKLSSSSINSHFRNITAFYGWLDDNDYGENKAIHKTKSLKVSEKIPVYFSDEEKQKILFACENEDELIMITLMLQTGMRREEISKVKISDFYDGALTIHGKGSRERILNISPDLIMLINHYINTRNIDSEYLFIGKGTRDGITPQAVYVRVMRILNKAGLDESRVKQFTPHKFRHSAATTMLDNDVDITTVAAVLGHSSTNTTRLYAHNTPNATKKAVSKLW